MSCALTQGSGEEAWDKPAENKKTDPIKKR
jgi:hypothetical protein